MGPEDWIGKHCFRSQKIQPNPVYRLNKIKVWLYMGGNRMPNRII